MFEIFFQKIQFRHNNKKNIAHYFFEPIANHILQRYHGEPEQQKGRQEHVEIINKSSDI